MRKLVLSLTLLLGVVAAPMSAQAGHPVISHGIPSDCTQYPSSVGGSYWPYVPSGQGYMYYCGKATSQHAQLVFSVIAANNNANFITTQMRNNGGIFFVYTDWPTYNTDFTNLGYTVTPETSNPLGVTQDKGSGNVPQWSVVFENAADIGALSDTQIQGTTAHELGHWLDFYDASISRL